MSQLSKACIAADAIVWYRGATEYGNRWAAHCWMQGTRPKRTDRQMNADMGASGDSVIENADLLIMEK